jgi:hypothetical protein
MAVGWEYQSVYKKHVPGTPYGSADEVLNDEGLDGWELVSVVVVNAVYENHAYEIFYLKRKAGPPAIPTQGA